MKKIVVLLIAIVTVAGTYAQKIDRSIRPTADVAPEIKLGKTASFTLENGLKVFVVENHKVPRVSFSLSLDIDPFMEGEIAGYAQVSGQLIGTKTASRTKQQIDEEIDFIGASLSSSSSSLYASSLKKHQEKLLTLMNDVLLNSIFTQEELAKIKKQLTANLSNVPNTPSAIMSNLRSVLTYGKNHPYGEIVTEKSVENITLADCNNYYNTYFKPNVAYLVVVGDITLAEAKPLVEKYFSLWKKGAVPSKQYTTPTAPLHTEVDFVVKEGATQSIINISYPLNLKKNSPDVVKARIMNAILGGGATGRLFLNLREKRAFTYGAYSSLRSDQLVGNFNASANVRNEVTDSAITQFMIELNRIINEKVGEKELQDVKNYLSGVFAYSLQNPQTIASFALATEKYNLKKDHYATYLQQIAAVTVDDLQAMAKKYIKPDNALILVVGDKSTAESLASFSADKKVNFYDIYGNPFKESIQAAPEGVTAQTVINKAIVAKYGLPLGKKLNKKLKQTQSIITKIAASVQGQSLEIIRYQKAPNKYSQTMSMQGNVVQKQTFNGETGKQSGMQGEKMIEGKELEEIKLDATLFLDTKYEALGFKFELIGIETIKEKDTYKIVVTKPNGNTETEWYSIETGLQVKSMSVQENEASGEKVTKIAEFSDYQEVCGIQYAHTIKQTYGPQSLDLKIESIEINTAIEDVFFE